MSSKPVLPRDVEMFSRGHVDEGFAFWKASPNGGAAPGMPSDITKYEWARNAYFLRNQDGSYVVPRSSWPADLGIATPHPYVYNDEDAAIQYAMATKKLFLTGRVDEAYVRYMNDPLGGGALRFCRTTKDEFVQSMQRMLYESMVSEESKPAVHY